ncbi:660_t:CDS:2 [Ambispora gerdemannii]|uniref:660_t:CDS:1 n=1 Tax=Ambispora gerdemannii TaxID=144530 RepID=A0A9N8WHU2_9GLOM|nr:660_t:CDS:2 [Ambispora gerdemannii]
MAQYFFQHHSRVPYQSGIGAAGTTGLLRNDFAPWKRDLQQLGGLHLDCKIQKYPTKYQYANIDHNNNQENFAKYRHQINVNKFPINNKNATILPSFFDKPQYIQFRIQSITIDDEYFDGKIASKTSPPFLGMGNLRYHYVKGSFGLYVNDNTVKILIPIEALDEIATSDLNSFVLNLKNNGGSFINYKILDETFTNKKIALDLKTAQSMKIIACEDTPAQKIDMTILHVKHELKILKSLDKEQQQQLEENDANAASGKGKTEDLSDEDEGDLLGSSGESAFAGWSSILDQSLFDKKCDDIENNKDTFDKDKTNRESITNSGTFLVKFHNSEEIRVFQFFNEVTYDEIKSSIQKTCGLQEIRKLKCKDEVGEMITITSQYDFNTAFDFYATNNKLELWLAQ